MEHPFNQLREACEELCDLGAALQLLGWDQQTYMPPKGGEARSRQIAALSSLLHEKLLSPKFDEILTTLEDNRDQLSDDERAFIREFTFDRDRSIKLPPSLVKEMALEQARGFEAWQRARTRKDFSLFSPNLKRLIELSRQKADCLGWEQTPWDALVQDYERGMTASRKAAILSPLRDAIIPLIDQIRGVSPIDSRFLHQKWEVSKQWEFGMRVARDMGYDFEAGRQDVAPHPFTCRMGLRDVRITTRFRENDLLGALLSTIHETGHALFEQGFRLEDDRTPLAESPSMGIHESQSRFWEIQIGRSRAFWTHYLPIARQYFPGQLTDVVPEQIYHSANSVCPSLIRVEADEITYNLHIIIRFEIELELLEGRLDVKDLPEVWNSRYRKYLGLEVPDDSQGCLQDVHWSSASFGYFPSYTLGNIYAAMFRQKIEDDIPDFWKIIERGEFNVPLQWLRTNIHQVGRRLTAPQLIEKIVGKPIGPEPLIDYFKDKYREIYRL